MFSATAALRLPYRT